MFVTRQVGSGTPAVAVYSTMETVLIYCALQFLRIFFEGSVNFWEICFPCLFNVCISECYLLGTLSMQLFFLKETGRTQERRSAAQSYNLRTKTMFCQQRNFWMPMQSIYFLFLEQPVQSIYLSNTTQEPILNCWIKVGVGPHGSRPSGREVGPISIWKEI